MLNHNKSVNGKPNLTNYLAADRKILANERTFLAYIRTALTLFVVGASFIKFFGTLILEMVGWLFIPVATIIFFMGVNRYKKTRSVIDIVQGNGFHTPDVPL